MEVKEREVFRERRGRRRGGKRSKSGEMCWEDKAESPSARRESRPFDYVAIFMQFLNFFSI